MAGSRWTGAHVVAALPSQKNVLQLRENRRRHGRRAHQAAGCGCLAPERIRCAQCVGAAMADQCDFRILGWVPRRLQHDNEPQPCLE